MNNNKERRLAKDQAKAERQHGDEPRYICPFPNCGKVFWRVPNQPDCCPEHRQFISDVYFVQEHVHRKPAELPGGLVVPKSGMGDLAIKQAARLAAKGGPNGPTN